MKKTLYILSAFLLGLASCNELEFEPNEPNRPYESRVADKSGLVAVTMELEIPEVELKAMTRAKTCSVNPQIDYIYVAVFGTSGYPQAYTLAEPITSATDETAAGYASTNYDTTGVANTSTQKYYFRVYLPVYDGEAHVHIIANGDESIPFVDQTEASIMEKMSTSDNVGAFWARVVLTDGILPEKDVNGIMTTYQDGSFIPDEPTADAFKNLVLVRNFAEVLLTIEEAAQTDLKNVTWTLVNVPTKGSVAPMAAGTYVGDFKDYTYVDSTGTMVNGSKTYNGFVFTDDPMNYVVPAAGSALAATPGTPLFLYERTLASITSSKKPTCILMRATFQNDPDPSYYRLDLMDDNVAGGYFPIYRNFRYEVKVHMVGNRGAATPTEAMNRDSGGNVSYTPEAQSLTDISDGISRLIVEYIEKNFTSGGKKTLRVQYIPNVKTGTVNNDLIKIRVKDRGLALKEGSEPIKLGTSSTTGYNFYQFELNEQDENADLESVLEVSASNGETGGNKSTLYRDITLRVLKKMDMELALDPKKVDSSESPATTVLKITLPENLPSSMFPLEFHIEDVNHTLTPTQTDGNGHDIIVPVKTDVSLSDGTSSSFYFIRTVNESEYNQSRTISTEFETVAASSATTVYVANEYFKTKSTNLLNDGMYVYPTSAEVDFYVRSMDIAVEFDDDSQSSTWSVTVPANSGITVTYPEGNTGTGYFTMTFPVNQSTTSTASRTVTVTSGSVSRTVTITQKPMSFSVDPTTQQVAFNATTAEVTVFASEGAEWTASISSSDPNVTSSQMRLSAISGTGTQTLTVTIPKNTNTTQRTFTIKATLTGQSIEVSAQIVQGRGPNQSSTFTASSFTYNSSALSGSATSGDGFVTIGLTNVGNYHYATSAGSFIISWDDFNPTFDTPTDFIIMGRRADERTTLVGNNNFVLRRGGITVTPAEGIKITGITITYSDATYASYDFGNTRVTVTPGTYTDSGSGIGTWTGTSTSAITFTNGYRNNSGTYNFPRITSIVVTYEAI